MRGSMGLHLIPPFSRGGAVGSQDIVLDLAEVSAEMLPLVGGKAASLGELIRANLPVPAGVCVTTEAYRQVADSVAVDFAALAAATGEGVEEGAARTREAFLAARIPGNVAEAIVSAYARLGLGAAVAVRSSATAEDLPHASFAGQQDTFLHVIGADAVLDAVRRCWASLWTHRAVVYRITHGIDHRTVRLAVVIQRMVDADVAGVLFTANPLTGRRRQAVIDAAPGLGESVVSGAVNPDHFVADADSGEILERRLGEKRLEVRPAPSGGTARVERAPAADRACLTVGQVQALAALGGRVEAHFGAPQDIEWAIDKDGRLWLTQSRPITTLFPLPQRRPGDNPTDLRVYLGFTVAQGLYRPLTPMGLSAMRVLSSAAARLLGIPVPNALAGAPVFAEAGLRVYIDLTGVLRGRVGRALMPRVLDVMEARSAVIVRRLCEDPRLSPTRQSPMLFIRRVLRIALAYGVPMTIVRALASPRSAQRRIEKIGSDLASRLEPPVIASAAERLDFAQLVLEKEMMTLAPRTIPVALAGLGMLAAAGRLLRRDLHPGDLQAVLRGLPHNVTTEMDLALWQLAQQIRRDEASASTLRDRPAPELAQRFHAGTLPEAAQRGLALFLSRYGHRTVAEIDLGIPRWSDDPAHLLGVLANYLRLDEPESAPDAVFARGAAQAEAMIEDLVGRARRRSRLRGALVRFALDRARQLAGSREIPKYYMVAALAAVRRELTAVGADLARRGTIPTPGDVFFLDLADARAALAGRDVRRVVAQNRETYEAELRRRRVPRVLLSDGTEPETCVPAPATSQGLSGTPASAGTVTAVARVVLDPVGAHLEPGEILVAPSTDPGWTPLFLTAGGLVMEMGGANSHGAVVAREYGIPAIVGVPGATARIRTGQRITVDGTAGTIALSSSESAEP
jgi:phosphohistidine swiveling domain-containing protein